MSMDYYVYLKQMDAFSSQSFEQYCSSLGLHIELHPSFNLLEDAGFSPIRLIDERFISDSGSHDFLSGFELFSSKYHHILQPLKSLSQFSLLPILSAAEPWTRKLPCADSHKPSFLLGTGKKPKGRISSVKGVWMGGTLDSFTKGKITCER